VGVVGGEREEEDKGFGADEQGNETDERSLSTLHKTGWLNLCMNETIEFESQATQTSFAIVHTQIES
jgi:hypothetical protein